MKDQDKSDVRRKKRELLLQHGVYNPDPLDGQDHDELERDYQQRLQRQMKKPVEQQPAADREPSQQSPNVIGRLGSANHRAR